MDPILNQLSAKIKESAIHRVRCGLNQINTRFNDLSREEKDVMIQAEIQRIIDKIVAGAK